MTTTPRLGITQLEESQVLPEVVVNGGVLALELGASRFVVLSKGDNSPAGGETDGQGYLVGASGSGAFLGEDNKLAFMVNGAWEFITALEGMEIEVLDEDTSYTLRGGTWVAASSGGAIEVLDEGASETTALVSLDFVGAGVNAADDGSGNVTVTISGGGGGGAWQLQWTAQDGVPPASNYATLDSRNSRPVLDFDTTTQEATYFNGVLPPDYAGGGVTVSIFCAMTSATTGTVGWEVSFERIDASSLDIDSDSFAAAQTVTATTVPGTSGQILKLSVNVSNGANMDSLAAGEAFRLKVARDVTNDTAAGDAELLRVLMVEQ